MVAKGRQHCGTGLPPATVRNILTSLASCRVLALRYGVGKSTIHRIRNRQVQNV
jgi:DNA-binding IclR family transcriptional regulator